MSQQQLLSCAFKILRDVRSIFIFTALLGLWAATGVTRAGITLNIGDILSASTGTDAIVLTDPVTGTQTVVSSGGLLSHTPWGVAAVGNREILVSVNGASGGSIVRVDPLNGTQTLVASGISMAGGIAVESSGNILITDLSGGKIIRVNPTTGASALITSGGNIDGPRAIALEANGNILVTSTNNSRIVRVNPTTGAQTVVSSGGVLGNPQWLAVNSSGDIFVTTPTGSAIIKVNPVSGVQSTVAAGGQLFSPQGIAVDANGNLVIANGNNKILRVNPISGSVVEIAGFGVISGNAGLTIFSGSAEPQFVSADWKTPGDKLLTRDTTSGLDWLDLTQTGNRSYNDVSSQLGPGGQFAGFRYATQAEVADLFSKFGLPFTFTPLSNSLHAGAESFHSFSGTLVAFDTNLQAARTEGLYEPPESPGLHRRIGVLLTSTQGGTSTGAHFDFEVHPIYGSYLVRSSDAPPVANAGPDQTVNEGTLVTLNGSGSIASQGGALSFSWTQLTGTPVTLSNSNSSMPTFTAPFVSVGGETLTFQLIVTEDSRSSEPSIVNIHVVNVNKIPVADAGADQTVQEGSAVVLNGANSFDPDAEAITFSWVQTAGTAVLLSGANAANPTFTAPLVGPAGDTLTFELTVSDGIDNSQPDYVNAFVENVNHSPIANAGADQTRDEGTLVALNGTGSTDPDGDALNYTWTQIGGPGVALSGAKTANPSFTAPEVGPGGATLVFQLVVNDGLGDVNDPDEVNITVQNVNDPPACGLAQPSLATLWPPNHKLVSVGIVNVSDPNNDQISVVITGVTQDEPVNGLGDGDTSPDAVLQGDKVLLRVERGGNGNGRVYQVTFSASDGQGGSCTGFVTVGVPKSMQPGNTPVNDGQLYNSTLP